MTKNPSRFLEFLDRIPENCVLGTTVESNRNYYGISGAPLMGERLKATMKVRELTDRDLFVWVEPVMDFDLDEFSEVLKRIMLCMLAVGYDNYSWGLREPELSKTREFIMKVGEFSEVILKTLREASKPTSKTYLI